MTTRGSPTIVERINASDSPIPSIPSLSPNASSSSDSFNSSRPNSRASSATSRSVSPSPAPKTKSTRYSQEPSQLPVLPSNPSPPSPGSISGREIHHQDDAPRSVPPASAAIPTTNHNEPWLHRLGSLIPRRNWIANAIGAVGLGLTLFGMIVYSERSYKLALLSVGNDLLSTCGQLNSTGVTLGPNCEKLLANNTADVTFPPYSHWKRTLNATLQIGSRLLQSGFTMRSTLPLDRYEDDMVRPTFSGFSSTAIILSSTVILGGLSIIIFRHYWKTEEVFTSPVRSDWQVMRLHQEGPEVISGEGCHIIRRNPEDNHPLGQLREKIRSSQPNAVENPTGEPGWRFHDDPDHTLAGSWEDTEWGTSKVSLTNDASDEKHENLIELRTKGPNKTFFDPETGEFIHLTPWKSTGDEEVHGLKPDGKGSTKSALIRMTLGASGWAGGKSIDDQLAEELQANSKGSEEQESSPRDVGDCITGHIIHENPSGKPVIV